MTNRPVIVALFFGGFVANLNNVAMFPYLSPMAADLDSTVPLVGQAHTAALLIGALAGLFVGPLSDHYGIRRVVTIGAALMALCGFGTAFAVEYWTLVLARIPGGLAFGVIMGLGAGIANTRLPEEERRSALGWMVSGSGLAVIIGAPVLAILGEFMSWRAGFAVVGTFGAALMPIYRGIISADPAVATERFRPFRAFSAYLKILSDRTMFGLQSVTLIWAVSWGGINTYFGAFALDSVGMTLSEFGYLFMLGGVFFLIGSRAAPILCQFWAPRWVIVPIAGLLALASALYFTVPSSIFDLALIIPLIGIAGGAGLPLTVILVSEVTNTRHGSVMMLRMFFYGIGAALGAALGGLFLTAGGYPAVGLGLAAFAGISALCVVLATHATPSTEASPADGND